MSTFIFPFESNPSKLKSQTRPLLSGRAIVLPSSVANVGSSNSQSLGMSFQNASGKIMRVIRRRLTRENLAIYRSRRATENGSMLKIKCNVYYE